MNGPHTARRTTPLPATVLLLLGVLTASLSGPSAEAEGRGRRVREIRAATTTESAALQVSAAGRITPAGRLASRQETSGHMLARIQTPMPVFRRPGGRRGWTMPAASPYYGEPTVAWVLDMTRDGRFGLVPVPYAGRDVTGWIRLRGLRTYTTQMSVLADLSRHRLWVYRGERVVLSARAATGAAASPTPTGRYTVSDRVAFPSGGVLGTYAFGLSGIQPNLPAGWSGGNQLAIHGTDDPSSIGRSASAGCLRVAERVLDRLRRLLPVGTPVVVRA